MQVAVDGPAGAGKSTVARRLAQVLNYLYIDTGAMYRAVAWQVIQRRVSLADNLALAELAEKMTIVFRQDGETQTVWIDGADATEAIRTPEISRSVAIVAACPEVRRVLVAKQQAMARTQDVVMEGRDIGSIVLPQAEYKFFVTAALDVRAQRRSEELNNKGFPVDLTSLRQEIADRDRQDAGREVGALQILPDFIVVDTSQMAVEEVVAYLAAIVRGGE
jgi:cytidylate kinase